MAQALLGLGIGLLLATLVGFVGDYGAYVRAAGKAEMRADREAARLSYCPPASDVPAGPGADCPGWGDDRTLAVCRLDADGWQARLEVTAPVPTRLLKGLTEVTVTRLLILQAPRGGGGVQKGPFGKVPECG